MKTETFTVAGTSGSEVTYATVTGGTGGWSPTFIGPDGKTYDKINAKFYDPSLKGERTDEGVGNISSSGKFIAGKKYFCTFDIAVNASVIEVSANTFPGTYYVTGDTFARNEASGEDEFFQFIIPKAKVTSENTITLEAEGDPSVFNMNLTVLRPADGVMMKLVKYSLDDKSLSKTQKGAEASKIYHNHSIDEVQAPAVSGS